jgi:death-on-curing protein
VPSDVIYVRLETLLEIANDLGVPHVRDMGLLSTAVQRPQTLIYGDEVYPSLSHKAAALVESLVRNHALVDGNKWLGWIGLALFLDMNGRRLIVKHDDGYDFIVGIASGQVNFDGIVEWISKRI